MRGASFLLAACLWSLLRLPAVGSVRVRTADVLHAATLFGDNDNHIIAYVGHSHGLHTLIHEIQTSLDEGSVSAPMCLDLAASDVQQEFRRMLTAGGGPSTLPYKLVIAQGAESLLTATAAASTADSARVLDFLYLISDKSANFAHVIVILVWDVDSYPGHDASPGSNAAEAFLLKSLSNFDSPHFNPKSFIGRLLAVHSNTTPQTLKLPKESVCATSSVSERAFVSAGVLFIQWLAISICVSAVAYSILVAFPAGAEPSGGGVNPDQQKHINGCSSPVLRTKPGRVSSNSSSSTSAIYYRETRSHSYSGENMPNSKRDGQETASPPRTGELQEEEEEVGGISEGIIQRRAQQRKVRVSAAVASRHTIVTRSSTEDGDDCVVDHNSSATAKGKNKKSVSSARNTL